MTTSTLNRRQSYLLFLLSIILLLPLTGIAQQAPQHLLHTRERYEEFINNHSYSQHDEERNREHESEEEEKDRPDEAMQQDFLRTLDPSLGYVPYERRLAALQHVQQWRRRNNPGGTRTQAAISGVTWTERGPDNVGGRTRCLMFDPNDGANGYKKVWAGSVGGGLWYNSDITSATSSWVHVDDLWDNIAISALAYDPSNTQVFYAGTGEGWGNADAIRGAGIWKTTDGGTIWIRLASTTTADFNTVQKIVVKSNGTILAATNAGLMQSTNGGTTWSKYLSNQGSFGDVEVAANGDLYASTQSGKIYKSTNASNGGSWSALNSVPSTFKRIELATAPSNSSIVYLVAQSSTGSGVTSGGGIYRTIDGGSSWTALTLPVDADPGIGNDFTRSQAWYDLILMVDPTNANTVFVGGVDLFKSINGGTSWQQISHWYGGFGFQKVHADHHAIAYKPGSTSEMIFGHDGGISYTTNGTASIPTISSRNKGYNVTQFYSCAISPSIGSSVMLAGAQDNGTQRFSAGGINSTREVIGGDGGFCFIDEDEPDIHVGSYTYNVYYVSTNDGTSFSRILNNSSTGSFVNPGDYDSKMNILYTANSSSAIYRILNVGTSNTVGTLSVALGTMATHIKVSPYSAPGNSTVFIGTAAGKIYKLTNAQGTPTLTSITGNLLVSGSVSCIDLGGSENRILVTFSNYGRTSVWETTNGGATWVNKEDNLPDMPVRWCLYNPHNPNQVMLATEVGVWSTSDISGAPNWQPSIDGLANVRVDMLKYRASDRRVVAATHGRGLFTSDVFAVPVASFSVSAAVSYTNKSLQFTDASLMATSWLWNFGDGDTSTQQNPQHSYTTPGTYTVTLTINGSVSKTASIRILPDRTVPYLMVSGGDFEANATDFAPWTIKGTAFERGNSTVQGKNGTTSGSNAWVTGLTAATYAGNTEARLYTPNFNLSGLNSYILHFKTNYSFEPAYDGFVVEYSLDRGSNWTKLEGYVESSWFDGTAASDNVVFPPSQAYFGLSTSGYSSKSIDISSLAGSASVAFRFVFKSDPMVNSAGMAIDDFQVETIDVTAPQLVTLSPANNASGVLETSNLVITFNESIQKGTGNIVIKENGTVVQTIPVSGTAVSISGTTATIDPPVDFSFSTAVSVEIASGVFKDMSNNAWAGNLTNTWKFTVTEPVNYPAVFTPGSNQIVTEDAGEQTVPSWATNMDDGNPTLTQNLSFVVTNSNPALFNVQPAVSSSGTLTYTPIADANGTASLTVKLVDDGPDGGRNDNSSDPLDFTITVISVNDAPSFIAGANQVVANDEAAQSISWAGNISAGPSDESGQVLTFNITSNSKPSLFAVQPAISSNGILTFTPAANNAGLATLTVTLSDNGGTVNGGADASPAHTFTIRVRPAMAYVRQDGNDGNSGTDNTPTMAKQTIQAAVNDLKEGGTVHITPGTYLETVEVDKNMTLVATGTPSIENLVMNGAGKILTISNDIGIPGVLSLKNGTVASDGHLMLLSTPSRTAMIDDFSAGHSGTITGTIKAQRYIPGSQAGFRYLSSPVTGAQINQLGNQYNIAYYNESLVSGSAGVDAGWVMINDQSQVIDPIRGLSSYMTAGDITNTLIGTANTGTYSTVVTRTQPPATTPNGGFNVIGNPYPSPISWAAVWNLNNDPAIHKTVYVWNAVLNKAGVYNFSTGLSANGGTNQVASGQAFRIRRNTQGSSTFMLNNTVRCDTLNNSRFLRREATVRIDELLRLSLGTADEPQGYETVIHAVAGATENIDASFDAEMIAEQGIAQLYSKAGKAAMTFNALPSLKTARAVGLGVIIRKAGEYTIAATEVAAFAPDTKIYLEDRKTGIFHDLTASPVYKVYLDQSEYHRFFVHFGAARTETPVSPVVDISAHQNEVLVQFSDARLAKGKITVINMLGQVVRVLDNRSEQQTVRLTVDAPEGAYLVQVENESGRITEKVYISKK